MKTKLLGALVATTALVSAPAAFAQEVTPPSILDIVTDNFSVAGPLAAIGVVAAGIILVRVTLKGISWAMSAIRG